MTYKYAKSVEVVIVSNTLFFSIYAKDARLRINQNVEHNPYLIADT